MKVFFCTSGKGFFMFFHEVFQYFEMNGLPTIDIYSGRKIIIITINKVTPSSLISKRKYYIKGNQKRYSF